MPEPAYPDRIVAIDPTPGGAIVTGYRDGDGVLRIDGVQPFDREAFNAWVSSFTEKDAARDGGDACPVRGHLHDAAAPRRVPGRSPRAVSGPGGLGSRA